MKCKQKLLHFLTVTNSPQRRRSLHKQKNFRPQYWRSKAAVDIHWDVY